jgi:hypothetical protein
VTAKSYGFFTLALFAIVELVDILLAFMFEVLPIVELLVFMFDIGVVAEAGVIVLTGAGVARLTLTLTLVFAASPQAMPIALNPRTAESTITFFIFNRLLSFSKI